MRIWPVALLLLGEGVVGCGSTNEVDCALSCARLADCGIKTSAEDCVSDCQVIQDVALDQSSGEWGKCMLESDCAQVGLETCLDKVADTAPAAEFERVLDRVCDRVVECELGVTHRSCKYIINQYGGKRIKQVRLLKKKVLGCVGDCVVATPCSQIVDAVKPCLTTCGVVFKTVK